MKTHAQKWSTRAQKMATLIAMTAVSITLIAPASSVPDDDLPKETTVKAATSILPGALKERAENYLAPSSLSTPDKLILTQIEKISVEKATQDAALKKTEEEEKAAQVKAAQEAAAQKAAEEKAAAEKAAAEKAAAEKAAAEKAASEKEATARAEATAQASRKTSRTESSTTNTKVTIPDGNGIACTPTGAANGLQAWPHAVKARIGQQFGIGTIGGYRDADSGEHGKGLALDVMTYTDSAKGNAVLQWVLDNHSELNVYYVIYEQKIYGSWTGWKGKPMEDRGSITQNHFDHVHISFNGGSGTCPSN